MILFPEADFAPGDYESQIVDIPNDVTRLTAYATRVGWSGDDNCLELDLYANHHIRGKWYLLVGFKADGSIDAPVSSVGRKIKMYGPRQFQVKFRVLRPIRMEIGVEMET